MKSGTVSVLFAEHSIIHSILVIIAWKKLYGKFPYLWEIVCILIHDIGYFGKPYLSTGNIDDHEILGAKIANKLFGKKGFELIYHHRVRNQPVSLLEAPDDYSWCLAPVWWLRLTWLLQRKRISHPVKWKIVLCERWIKRFNGSKPTSLWESEGLKNNGRGYE